MCMYQLLYIKLSTLFKHLILLWWLWFITHHRVIHLLWFHLIKFIKLFAFLMLLLLLINMYIFLWFEMFLIILLSLLYVVFLLNMIVSRSLRMLPLLIGFDEIFMMYLLILSNRDNLLMLSVYSLIA